MTVTGTGVAAGTTVGTVNTNTRVVTLSAALTLVAVNIVIFGEETSVNWVNIDIQRTKTINASLAGQGLHQDQDYTYMVTQLKHHHQQQEYRVLQSVLDKMEQVLVQSQIRLNCLLVANGATAATTQSASISPYGPSVSGLSSR